MREGGACRAPLQLEWARVLVPLHLPVTRRSGLPQTHSPHSSHQCATAAPQDALYKWTSPSVASRTR